MRVSSSSPLRDTVVTRDQAGRVRRQIPNSHDKDTADEKKGPHCSRLSRKQHRKACNQRKTREQTRNATGIKGPVNIVCVCGCSLAPPQERKAANKKEQQECKSQTLTIFDPRMVSFSHYPWGQSVFVLYQCPDVQNFAKIIIKVQAKGLSYPKLSSSWHTKRR